MKKSVLILLVLSAALLLSGCIDVVHYISKDIAGDTEVYFKVAVSKAVFQMAESMGGGGDTTEEPAEGPDMNMDAVREQFPQWVDVSFDTIDNEAESGFALRYSVDKQRQVPLEDPPPLFPIRTKDGFDILLPAQEKEEGGSTAGQSDQMGSLFLASSHYKIILSKKVAAKIQSAELTVGGESYPVAITNLEDLFVLEIPFLPWFLSSGQTCTVKIRAK